MKDILNIEAFELNDSGQGYAEFSFSFNGEKVRSIRALISTREAGDMALPSGGNKDLILRELYPGKARQDLFNSLQINSAYIYSCVSTHSRNVAAVEYPESRLLQDADGLVGMAPAILSVTVADCLPVYLYDNLHKVFALCHSGWKGTGIAACAVELMKEKYKTRPGDISAILGPCIQGDCYTVDEERAAQFQAEFGGYGEYPLGPVVYEKQKNNTEARESGAAESGREYHLDMQAANAHILADCGVKNISYCVNCTFTDPGLGSFRREGPVGFTKMLAMIGGF
ncbi:MAG: polyphenol oxidase family protein [Spirochaetaceae bacterium]|nr:polyphenol oxidase family protein [Spirochaetaceae bacterium]